LKHLGVTGERPGRGIYASGAALKAYPFWLYSMPGKPDHILLSQMPIPYSPKE